MTHNSVIIPEHFIESTGVACGDEIKLFWTFEGQKVHFLFSCKACSIVQQTVEYLQKELNGLELENILQAIGQLLENKPQERQEQWISEIPEYRKTCFFTPVKILKMALTQQTTPMTVEEEFFSLSCDACVKSCPIVWIGKDKLRKKQNESLLDIYIKIPNDDFHAQMLMRMSKLELTGCELKKINNGLAENTLENIELAKKLRLPALLHNSSLKHGWKLPSTIFALAERQFLSMKYADMEIESVNAFISEKHLRIVPVKGGVLAELYGQLWRTHLDYDYVAETFADAFALIHHLIENMHFKMILGGGVPFSLKVVEEKGQELLLGHLHLEKILLNQYQVIVDINIGGFPLGRTGVLQIDAQKGLSREMLACVTLAHLFKHDKVFMKDINDLYLLLSSASFDHHFFLKYVERYGMKRYLRILVAFLRKEYGLHFNLEVMDFCRSGKAFVPSLLYRKWPYSRRSHFLAKAYDLLINCIRKEGFKKGLQEFKSQLHNTHSDKQTALFQQLCQYCNRRTYLQPVVIFKKILDLNIFYVLPKEASRYRGDFISNRYLVITPIGLFLSMDALQEKGLQYAQVAKEINWIIQQNQISSEDLDYGYMATPRKDLWLY